MEPRSNGNALHPITGGPGAEVRRPSPTCGKCSCPLRSVFRSCSTGIMGVPSNASSTSRQILIERADESGHQMVGNGDSNGRGHGMALHQGTASLQTRRGGGFRTGEKTPARGRTAPRTKDPRSPTGERAERVGRHQRHATVAPRAGTAGRRCAWWRPFRAGLRTSERRLRPVSGEAGRRSLHEQATASATWTGILVDLAEQAALVTAVVAGRRRHGRVAGIGGTSASSSPSTIARP